ncbi:hypothetical protein D0866_04357 [Hortaea werneckii]|uniref:Major facilitator superfamily (MFS) profile domain-containing protein n=1 Tax=Hortaea werneckii TaxID=91943 RepID=A0A3M7B7M3_HORWE|nr:hypothetical protein D0866_04357 [Hortaea werneckii]
MGGPIAASSPTLDFENVRYGQAGYKGLIREPYILSLACFASIGGFLFGYDQGAISSVLVMPSFERIFPLLSSDATLQGWMVSVLTLGAMFGALINGPICDRFSRRWSLLYATIVFNIGSILQAAAYNISMIFVGRCIAGIAIGMLSMVVPLYLLVAMQQLGITLVQQFTGINAIIYYAPQIFQKIGLQGNSVDLLATGVVGIIDVVATIPAIMFLDRWGRRPVLMAGAVGMGISQLIVGTLYAVYNHSWAGNTSAGWATAAFVWIYIGNFAWSIGCVNWIVPSEIMPPGIRGKAVGLAIATNWLSNFIVALITPRMLKSIESVHFGDAYTLKDVYKVAKDQNVIVVDGGTSTVGALNGCVLGSGHGPESRYYGFGADQVLEAQVVLFDGYVVTANPCEKLNLFWAIRSGGPGTYGLVIPITVKAYPMASVQVQHLAMAPLPESDSDDLLDAIAILYAAYPDSNDGGYAGYGSWMLNSTTPVSANFTTGYVHGFYAFDSDLSTVQSIFAPTLERLESFNTTSLYISLDYVSYPTYWDFFHAESGVEPAVGVPAAMGSRLFSRSSVQDDHVSLRRMIAVIAGLPEENTSNNFELVSGGINFQRPADYSGVNPAWRKSYFSNIVSRGWALDASEAVVQSVYDDVVFTKQAAMEAQAPDTGAYMNEASWVDPNYEKNFYGEHYDALSEIKGKRDPCGEFYCKTCVGSDAWAEDSEGRR